MVRIRFPPAKSLLRTGFATQRRKADDHLARPRPVQLGQIRCNKWPRSHRSTVGNPISRPARRVRCEATLRRAYIEANRLQKAKRLLDVRRPGASGVAVMGIAAVH
jgi:hypothetical protein